MDLKKGLTERPKFAPPVVRPVHAAGKSEEGMDQRVEFKNEENKGERKKEEVTPGKNKKSNRGQGLGGKPMVNVKQAETEKNPKFKITVDGREEQTLPKSSDGRNGSGSGEETQKLKKLVKKQRENGDNIPVIMKKKAQQVEWRGVAEEETEKKVELIQKKYKTQAAEKSKENNKKYSKIQSLTNSQYDDIFDSVLRASPADLMDDARAMLNEVELMQASIDQETHCLEEEEKREEQDKLECSHYCSTALERMKKKSRTPSRGVNELTDEDDTDTVEYASWVQCSKADCGKWRKLQDNDDPSTLSLEWTCDQNTDPVYNSCSAPEEKSCASEENTIFCNLVPGSLVWAKQSGYPWWPAMIEKDPDSDDYLLFRKRTDRVPCKCHVTYLGTPVTRAWVPFSRVKNYMEPAEELARGIASQQVFKKKLKDAVHMARQALKLSLRRRLAKFGFLMRYVSDRENSEEDSDIADILGLFCGKSGRRECSGDEELKPSKRKRKMNTRKGRGEKVLKTAEEDQKNQGQEENTANTKRPAGEVGTKTEKVVEKRKAGGINVHRRRRKAPRAVETAQKASDTTVTGNEKNVKLKGKVRDSRGTRRKPLTPSFRGEKKRQGEDEEIDMLKENKETDGGVKEKNKNQSNEQKTNKESQDRSMIERGEEDEERKERGQSKKEEENPKSQKEDDPLGDEGAVLKPGERFWRDEDDKDGFLDTDMEILGCRDEELKRIVCGEEEEDDFSLMMFEEE